MLFESCTRYCNSLLTTIFWLTFVSLAQSKAYDGSDLLSIVARMPTYVTQERDSYLCMRVELPEDETFSLVGFEPLADQSQVHHMLLFGCLDKSANTKDDVWHCRMAPSCEGMDGVLYGWGRNAPSVKMPESSGFTVGKKSSTKALVLQIHFLELRREDDESGLKILLSRLPVENAAGMTAFASSFSIPPKEKSHLVENTCCFSNIFPSTTFASRVHTHALGRKVTLDIHSPGKNKVDSVKRIVDLDPLKPQGFYKTSTNFNMRYGDKLKATCDFNSESQSVPVKAGHTAEDEMCNLYLMWTSAVTGFSMCVNGRNFIKKGSGLSSKVVPIAENQFWKPGTEFGQISGVFFSQSEKDSVWLFSRKTVIWDSETFFENNKIRKENELIEDKTISRLDLQTGKVIESFGDGEFLLPHMISEAPDGYLWVTDVGSHQVHKVVQGNIRMSLGQRNNPGSSKDQFCKPTEAIETREGRLFIADGYCNDRIVEYNASTGSFVRSYDMPMEGSLPHSIVYDECNSVLLIALRLKQEIIKFDLAKEDFILNSWSVSSFGQPFAIRLGMYGIPYVLTWDLKTKSHLLELSTNGKISQSWELPGVRAPHDFVFVPSPTSDHDPIERNISIIVTETTSSGESKAIKYVFQNANDEYVKQSPTPQKKSDNLKDSFSHMNTDTMVKLDSDYDDGNEKEKEKESIKVVEDKEDVKIPIDDFADESVYVGFSKNVFIFALSLSMIVLWGFLQTLGTSQRLTRTRM